MSIRTTCCALGFAAMLLAAGPLAAQDDMPAPDGDAADATIYAEPTEEQSYSVQGPDGQTRTMTRQIIRPQNAYRSPTLQGEFRAQWMYIIQRGRMVTFWGARIVKLDPDSPLRQLGVRRGDVITRLDGVPIWHGMYKENDGPWQIVELERHYGITETRYILQGQHVVRVGQMILDGGEWDDDSGIEPISP